jgi:hypothetical protein
LKLLSSNPLIASFVKASVFIKTFTFAKASAYRQLTVEKTAGRLGGWEAWRHWAQVQEKR